MDAQQFRADFPEFADTSKYPTAKIDFWLRLGEKLLPPDRWCDLWGHGIELFVAHHLAVAGINELRAFVGAVPGQAKGALTSKVVDKVSAGYDSGTVTLADGGFWNMTTYGIEFLQLARMVGAGGIQL